MLISYYKYDLKFKTIFKKLFLTAKNCRPYQYVLELEKMM